MNTSRQAEPDWASYHLFYHGSGDRLLSRLVLPVVRGLWDRRRIVRFFFIRYGLDGPHIRLRLLCVPGFREEVDGAVRHAAAGFFKRWPSETGLDDDEIRRRNRHFPVTDVTSEIDAVYPNNSLVELPFQPEVERYGGPDLIAHSLDFFCISSAYTLRLIEKHHNEPRPRRLFRAIQTLFRQVLGFASDREDLYRLVSYAAMGNGRGRSLLVERADREFERCPEDYIRLVCEVIESQCTDFILKDAARVLGWRIRDAAGPAWWRIVGSQLHMTANRMGLMSAEEIYLGHILHRALADAGSGLLSSLGYCATDHDRLSENRPEELITASLRNETSTSPGLLIKENGCEL